MTSTPMPLTELEEISSDFLDAWKYAFGQEMYYVSFSTTSGHDVYREARIKSFDLANKKLFHGLLKEEEETKEKIELAGKKYIPTFSIIFITKELFDQGIEEIDLNARIQVLNRAGVMETYEIISIQRKVKLVNHNIFTKIGVKSI